MLNPSEQKRPFGGGPIGVGAPSFDALAEDAERDRQDRRRTRWTLLVAALAHVLLLLATLPDLGAAAATGPKRAKKTFKIEPLRFKPPPPKAKKPIPKRKAKKIPIPDPTPDEPEPIVEEEAVELEFEMPEIDLPFGIPDAPPSTNAGPPVPGNVFSVGSGVSKPVKIFHPKPPYTEEARQARIQGTIVLQLVVLEDGSVTGVKVLRGLPRGLEQSAIDTVRTWRFEPGTKEGKPVPVQIFLNVNFSLN